MSHRMTPGHPGLQQSAAEEPLAHVEMASSQASGRMLGTACHQGLKSRRGMDHPAVSCGVCCTRALQLPPKPVVQAHGEHRSQSL